jgi:lipoate-protein ligase A
MNCLDLTLPTPAENLACDEALLDVAERGGAGEVLRFWESTTHFVVLGYGNQVKDEVNIEACRAAGIPILRRCSGGGTVVQGPGCLNYSLVLNSDENSALGSISSTNRFVMERHRQALALLLGQRVTVEGHTDLAVGDLKFSGNAQRRKRHWLLFHGTFLLDFDLERIEKLLFLPSRQPEYRQGRSHAAFLTRLQLTSDRIKSALREAWDANAPSARPPEAQIAQLVADKYSRDEWNLSR